MEGGGRFKTSGSGGYQVNGGGAGKAAPIGLEATAANVTNNRRWLWGLFIFALLACGVGVAALVISIQDYQLQVDEDSTKNNILSKNVEIFLQNGPVNGVGGSGIVCSGVFIGSSGQILTAAHCLYTQNPTACNFVPTPTPHYPSTIVSLSVEVMNVNGTGAKYTFPGQVVAWSGITDIAIIQLLPLTRSDGSVITANNQAYFTFASQSIERGQILDGFGFDMAFYKKSFHSGPIKHPRMEIGTQIFAATEQVFVDTVVARGGSGSGFVDQHGNLVIAPISFSWTSGQQGKVANTTVQLGVPMGSSGTSYRVAQPMVNRMLNPATPANGVNGQYLVPTLGIIALGPVDAVTLWTDYSAALYPLTENKGIIFKFLATSNYFNTTGGCGQNYVPTPPSLLNAPLDDIITGTPPEAFPAIPAGGDANTVVALIAIEKSLNSNHWQVVGSDAGLHTISGAILSNNYWVGDVMRVQIRSFDVTALNDPTKNWEGIYSVTLQPVDPFYDTAYGIPFATYANLVLVDENPFTGQRSFYLPPNVPQPQTLRGHITGNHDGRRGVQEPHMEASGIGHPPADVDWTRLPTIAEYYMEKQFEAHPAMRRTHQESMARRARYVTSTPSLHRQQNAVAQQHHYIHKTPARMSSPRSNDRRGRRH